MSPVLLIDECEIRTLGQPFLRDQFTHIVAHDASLLSQKDVGDAMAAED